MRQLKKKKKNSRTGTSGKEREGSFFHPGSWKTEKLNQVRCPGNLGEAGPGLLNQGSRPLRVGPSGQAGSDKLRVTPRTEPSSGHRDPARVGEDETGPVSPGPGRGGGGGACPAHL